MPDILYAIGDIHGRLDLLERAEIAILEHAGDCSAKILCLGDYVDRGPNSKGVIDYLIKAEQERNFTCLMGNHETMMVDACRNGGAALDHWLASGGDATLKSYGVDGLSKSEMLKIPESHLEWMDNLLITAYDEHRIYVHAGLMPGLPLEEQDEAACLWIRERFLKATADKFPDNKHIVHGHTVKWAKKPEANIPELLPHRTNLDTAAFASGVLTVGAFYPEIRGGPTSLISVTR